MKVLVCGLLGSAALVVSGCAVEATDEAHATPEQLIARDEATKSPQAAPPEAPPNQPEPSPWRAMFPAAQPEPSPWTPPKNEQILIDAMERQKDPQPGSGGLGAQGALRIRTQEIETAQGQP